MNGETHARRPKSNQKANSTGARRPRTAAVVALSAGLGWRASRRRRWRCTADGRRPACQRPARRPRCGVAARRRPPRSGPRRRRRDRRPPAARRCRVQAAGNETAAIRWSPCWRAPALPKCHRQRQPDAGCRRVRATTRRATQREARAVARTGRGRGEPIADAPAAQRIDRAAPGRAGGARPADREPASARRAARAAYRPERKPARPGGRRRGAGVPHAPTRRRYSSSGGRRRGRRACDRSRGAGRQRLGTRSDGAGAATCEARGGGCAARDDRGRGCPACDDRG